MTFKSPRVRAASSNPVRPQPVLGVGDEDGEMGSCGEEETEEVFDSGSFDESHEQRGSFRFDAVNGDHWFESGQRLVGLAIVAQLPLRRRPPRTLSATLSAMASPIHELPTRAAGSTPWLH